MFGASRVAAVKGWLADNKGWAELNSPIVISDILPTTLPRLLGTLRLHLWSIDMP